MNHKHLATVDQTVIYHKQRPGGGSDSTLKRDIRDIQGVLATVLALRPVSWRWKTEVESGSHYGFIAQEVEELLPHLVTEDTWKDGTQRKFLTTDGIMPFLVSALKEQQAQIQSLQASVEKLTTKQQK